VPLLARLTFAVVAGVSLCAAFPGHDLWALAAVGVALLAVATCGARARTGFLLGLVTGLIFFGYSLSWSGTVVGVAPWAALAVLQALFVALLGAATAFLQSRGPDPRIRPGVVALAWVVQEALRDRVPYGGFPWVRLAFSQADSPLGRLAALAGAPLVTFAVALAGGLLAAVVWDLGPRWRRGVEHGVGHGVEHGVEHVVEHGPRRYRALLALVGLVVVAVVGFAVPLPTDGTPADVMAVQGNVPRPGLDFNAERRQVLDNHVTATEEAAAEVAAGTRPRPDLVVWPENSSDIDPTRNDDAAAQIARAVDAVDAPLVVGTLLEQPAPDVSNVALLYEPGKGIVETYVKQHPVPFAEYIPSRDFFRRFSDKVDLVRSDFAAGSGPVQLRVPAASGGEVVAGPTICFEVAYDDLVRANVDLGANLLLVQTNNATFGYSDESVQQLAISRIRAMEHGRSVVHVSTVGVSALITPDGTVHQPSALFTRTVLSGSLPLRSVRTVATVVGPWPEYAACLAFAAVVLLAGLRRRTPAEPATRIPPPPARTKEPHRG
jgi:apolipoprotein N-acyltransferase